ncbi:hypothetical protein NUW54_g9066 [Trametes sanguinea]|uniref:Uncharacterized protein n=1 Tax=Trametes sanguinea TaxID=158606 RepID=A0ACC1P8T8_9APHY|nr:hypothetical protein NUW54_g9066 [Trametes sanguinea]
MFLYRATSTASEERRMQPVRPACKNRKQSRTTSLPAPPIPSTGLSTSAPSASPAAPSAPSSTRATLYGRSSHTSTQPGDSARSSAPCPTPAQTRRHRLT